MSQAQFGQAAISFVAFLLAICIHEWAHAWVAKLRGDNTATLMGRLTLNPMAHADPIGTFLLPIIGLTTGLAVFGWAKPVPVNPRNLHDERNDMFWVAAAGPGSNLILAAIGTILLFVFIRIGVTMPGVAMFLEAFVFINLILCFFNLIPLHPLDGGTVIGRFLPLDLARKLEEMQMYSSILLLALFVLGLLKYILYPVLITKSFMYTLAEAVIL